MDAVQEMWSDNEINAPLSEKDAKLTQKLGQPQPFIAVCSQECMGQLA
jgi:hypothetical protein